MAMVLFTYRYTASARSFKRWYGWASRCRLKPMMDVAAMLKRRLENILTFIKRQITNWASESLNAKIQWVKYTARGIPESAELCQRNLLSLRWVGLGTLTT